MAMDNTVSGLNTVYYSRTFFLVLDTFFLGCSFSVSPVIPVTTKDCFFPGWMLLINSYFKMFSKTRRCGIDSLFLLSKSGKKKCYTKLYMF